jgi:hypothetical protein
MGMVLREEAKLTTVVSGELQTVDWREKRAASNACVKKRAVTEVEA